jgi:hypothetical protein
MVRISVFVYLVLFYPIIPVTCMIWKNLPSVMASMVYGYLCNLLWLYRRVPYSLIRVCISGLWIDSLCLGCVYPAFSLNACVHV